ncbi:glutamine--fructose-6-phosphate transaminase (isomerizing) [Pandoraea communis]|uniref:Glutamine--fructose-6-phosphate aminotransferase [isomerizing] n=1 Tax=Pandoraea communis TaxID=2508297 RepID=A0A5E4VH14_9BURK|nr:glutamine--fructose-6-phosphate transaminase (isomerizing) [Pandoraea communis]MDM8357585.1 glutamine--fructose-6-phosphate transaminase (isomerizing) [Pandoraea communis]VVE11522.1 Glutamine--fructose-6-phosphate aminotransferase [isomerizing] [Pandoraea communis]
MCGIVGGVASRDVVPVLVEGLRRLEYRGYDSCGVAVLNDQQQLARLRSVSRVAELQAQLNDAAMGAPLGIAHTRWATHGAPATKNAHPIFSRERIGLVHNGIIENHETLRDMLRAKGYEFASETDTEVIAHLVDAHFHANDGGDLVRAVRSAIAQLHGAYAIAVVSKDEPKRMVCARQGSPLVIGFAADGHFLASDALALAGHCARFIYLEEGDVALLTPDSVTVFDAQGAEVDRVVREMAAYQSEVALGPYQHYMQKEIFEQPRAIADTISSIAAFSPMLFGDAAVDALPRVNSVLILACGTSYYAGLTAKYWLESIAGIPTQVEIASEYRYRESVPNPQALVVTISQSGETADTLAALKHAQRLGHEHTLAVCNVQTSALVRQTAMSFITRAGAEIGVASTKAFTTQLVALFALAVTLGIERGRIDANGAARYLTQLRHLPAALTSVLALEPQIIAWAARIAAVPSALFLGRGRHYPIALEGALKLKEISYIHAEAYPAGELKHGPLALVSEQMPVVTIAPNDVLVEKLKSNMQEVRARGGELYVLADDDIHMSSTDGIRVIRMPEHYGELSPVLHVVPLQLLAYHTACARGTDVDKPRNLAKSVTVE